MWGVVASIQDHGSIIDVGLEGISVFVTKKEQTSVSKVCVVAPVCADLEASGCRHARVLRDRGE